MKVSEHFSSNYLKTEDFDRDGQNVTIARVEVEQVGKEDEKPVLYFDQYEEGMPLNKTNAMEIVDILGEDDTDDWEGRDINVYQSKTMFEGKRVACLRVRAIKKAAGKNKSSSANAQASA